WLVGKYRLQPGREPCKDRGSMNIGAGDVLDNGVSANVSTITPDFKIVPIAITVTEQYLAVLVKVHMCGGGHILQQAEHMAAVGGRPSGIPAPEGIRAPVFLQSACPEIAGPLRHGIR